MRIAALIFGLLGVTGSGFLGAKWLSDVSKLREQIDLMRKLAAQSAELTAKMTELDRMVMTAYALLGAAVLGLIAVALVGVRKGLIAAVLFLVGFAVPLAILGEGKIAIFTFPLLLAGVFSFFVKPPLLAPHGSRPLDPA